MMILKDFDYITHEGAEWQNLALTSGELDLIEIFLDELLPPIAGNYIKLPLHLKFLPQVNMHSCRFNNRVWDAFNGWRN